tara:strand:+ start:1359 stop:1499 length:141 start_codon:yes stop_codon:yes gene_type:complete
LWDIDIGRDIHVEKKIHPNSISSKIETEIETEIEKSGDRDRDLYRH